MPVLLPCIIIFVIILKYKLRIAEREEQAINENFHQIERRASLPIKKSLQSLPKIEICLSSLPFCENATGELKSCQDTIKVLSSQTISNLTGISNTDLKLKYGAGNLDEILEYEQNYLLLIKTLSDWGTRLYEQHNYKDAETVLDYAVFCQSNIRQTYITLARIYLEQNNIDKVHNLAKKTEDISSTLDLKKAIYGVLNESDDVTLF
ncbi:MAG: hypothetical protein HFJ09_09830 [Lachnospiraceae bacterium]|nr:hypothetical protein [Lachnospiraceae bacterium]